MWLEPFSPDNPAIKFHKGSDPLSVAEVISIGTFALAVLAGLTTGCASTGAVPRPFPVPGSASAPPASTSEGSRTVPKGSARRPGELRRRRSPFLHDHRSRRVACGDCHRRRSVRARTQLVRRRPRRTSQLELLVAAIRRRASRGQLILVVSGTK